MAKLTFTTTGAWCESADFGCASLGLAGICDNCENQSVTYPAALDGIVLTGTYDEILQSVSHVESSVHAAIVVFGNVGGENQFLKRLQQHITCPMVGGGAAIDALTGASALITGRGEAAVFLVTDAAYTYTVQTKCIHNHILGECELELEDARTIRSIDGIPAVQFLAEKKKQFGLSEQDFEHLTLSDRNNVNAHLSCVDGVIKSGRDLDTHMILRRVEHADVYHTIRDFYNDQNAIVFGCAGLSGLLDRPLDTHSLGLFLFGEVCTVGGVAEFGNLMLSKLIISEK